MNVLEVEELEVQFPSPSGALRAVDGVSFALAPGQVLGLVGESGSGKTMTGYALLRLVPPPGRIAGGRVRLDGRDLLRLSEAEMRRVRGDRIAVMYAGRIVEHGPADAVIGAPLHPYAEGLMASVPARNQPSGRLRQIPGGMPGLAGLPAGCAFRPRCLRADAACMERPALAERRPGHAARCVHPLLPC